MKIADIHIVVIHGDSVSNVMRTNNRIHLEQGWDASLVSEHFSTFNDVLTYAMKDYFRASPAEPVREFLFTNKSAWAKGHLPSRLQHKPKAAYDAIEKSDIRVWHFGSFYALFYQFHRNDVLFYYGMTYPFLSYTPATTFDSYAKLQVIKSLDPRVITISDFIKEDLLKQGFDSESIRVLPLFHTYHLPYIDAPRKYRRRRHRTERDHGGLSEAGARGAAHGAKGPHLLAYGRYAKNKAVPELARLCSEAGLGLTHFGDSTMSKEFIAEYRKASQYAGGNVRILPRQGQIEDFFEDADIYVCNSYHEGFNLPIIESEAHSMPVLARRGTAMDDLVTDNYNGFLFDTVDEIPELAGRIMKDYRRFRRNAWKHSCGYTYERYRRRYLATLKDLKKGQFAKG